MNKIVFPLTSGMRGSAVLDLQAALQLCLDRSAILANDADARKELSSKLQAERVEQMYRDGICTRQFSQYQIIRRLF